MVLLQHVADGRRAVAGRIGQRARLHRDEACDQIEESGFAASGRTDNGCKFTGVQVKADIVQCLCLAIFCVIGVGEISDR